MMVCFGNRVLESDPQRLRIANIGAIMKFFYLALLVFSFGYLDSTSAAEGNANLVQYKFRPDITSDYNFCRYYLKDPTWIKYHDEKDIGHCRDVLSMCKAMLHYLDTHDYKDIRRDTFFSDIAREKDFGVPEWKKIEGMDEKLDELALKARGMEAPDIDQEKMRSEYFRHKQDQGGFNYYISEFDYFNEGVKRAVFLKIPKKRDEKNGVDLGFNTWAVYILKRDLSDIDPEVYKGPNDVRGALLYGDRYFYYRKYFYLFSATYNEKDHAYIANTDGSSEVCSFYPKK